MTVGVHCDNLLLVVPLWEGTDVGSGFSVSEVWLVCDVEILASYSKRVVDGI